MPGLSEAFERIGIGLEHHLPLSHAGGIALAVTDREEILGVAVRGFADAASGQPVKPETRFEIGSISKSFAAAVVMQEVEEGRLDLHVGINEILPWLELPEPFGPITLHHLLTHGSGLPMGTEDAPTGWGAAARLQELAPTFAPGEHFWYSNDAYKLVGLALERVTGTPIHDLLHQRLLAPLGMASSVAAITDEARLDLATGYEPMVYDRPPQLTHPLVPATWLVSNTADGSIVSNVIDMSAYARFLLNGGTGPDGPVLSAAAFAQLTTPHIDDPDDPDGAYAHYAYGLAVQAPGAPRRFIAHTGGMVGYTAQLLTLPDEGLGCVLLQNGYGSMRAVADFALEAVRANLAGEALPEVPPPRDPEAHPKAADFAGVYVGDRRTFEISVEDGHRVRLKVGPVGVVLHQDPLEAPSDAFLVPHGSLDRFALRFVRDREDRVVEAFHGDEWFRGERYAGPDPEPHPVAWEAFPGVYRSNIPWGEVMRIVLRKGRLALIWPREGELGEEDELTPLRDGWFAVGETWTPRRIRFDRVLDGHAAVAEFNGGRWYRSFET
jgi:CubicO group peptidase (beta-lactamase class C family)